MSGKGGKNAAIISSVFLTGQVGQAAIKPGQPYAVYA